MQMLDPNNPDIFCGANGQIPEASTRPVRFMLLTHPRTGTQMVANALEGYACVRLFNLYAASATENKSVVYYSWLRHLWGYYPAGVTHLGTTMHRVGEWWIKEFARLHSSGYWRMIANSYPLCICLHRKNLLRQLLSRKIGAAIGSYDVLSPRDAKPSPGPIKIDISELSLFVASMESLREYTDSHFDNPLVVAYESLLSDWDGTISRIQEYLGLPPNPAPPFTHRQERRRLSEAISNYTEVAKWTEDNNHTNWLRDE